MAQRVVVEPFRPEDHAPYTHGRDGWCSYRSTGTGCGARARWTVRVRYSRTPTRFEGGTREGRDEHLKPHPEDAVREDADYLLCPACGEINRDLKQERGSARLEKARRNSGI